MKGVVSPVNRHVRFDGEPLTKTLINPIMFRLPFCSRGLHLIAIPSVFAAFSSLVVCAESFAIINEFHYNSADNSSPEEFIELYNPGDEPYDLTGHALADAVTYAFPAGISIPAGGFLVIAQDPATIMEKFGIAGVLGPWSGNLSSSGEEIELRNAANVKVDSVDYKAGFPWPTMADGGGPSAELIHPGLDNSLGSSWRSSVVASSDTVYVPFGSGGWRYKKGTEEPSPAVGAWRATAFDDDGWLAGQTPIGYDEDPNNGLYEFNTELEDMRGNYTSLYLRKNFTLPEGPLPSRLALSVFGDDGYVIWINGHEVARVAVPARELPRTASASVHNLLANPEVYLLTNTEDYLVNGKNTVAVHMVNAGINSSDLFLDLRLNYPSDAGTTIATPGAPNSTLIDLTDAPPAITAAEHSPQQPLSGKDVTIHADLSDPDGMGEVSLLYQIVDPGNYIRLNDSAYLTAWTTVPMVDDGTNGDAIANDGRYTAVIPGSVQTHRRLIRYKIQFADAQGNSQIVPYEEDETPNFAYFVYDGIPPWTGAMRPASHNSTPFPDTPMQIFGEDVMRSMHAIHLIANETDVNNTQYGGVSNSTRFRGTLIQHGVVYDHVEYRVRGKGSIYQSGKNKWKIYFNRTRDFQAYDNYGRPYMETWNELPINANASPWAPLHRGSAGVEEASGNRLYQLAGMAAMHTQFFQFRVIDHASEHGTNQYEGDLWGLYMGFEPTEGNFIDEHGLPDGNLYAIEGNNGDQQRQGLHQVTDGSDWIAFRNGLAQSGQTEAWYRENVELDALYTFIAINRLIGNVDVRPGDNYRFYRNPITGKWLIIPYDLDMMYIAAHHWGGGMDGVHVAGAPHVFRAIMRHPNIAREYRNRCREILSLAASDGTASGGQIGQLIAEYASFVNPPGQAQTWVDIDAFLWNLHPRTRGNVNSNSGQSDHKGNFFRSTYYDSRGAGGTTGSSWIRTLPDSDEDGFSDHEGLMQWFVNYATDTWTPNTPGETWNRKAMTGIGNGNDTANLTRQLGFGYKYLEFEALNGGWGDANANPPGMPLHADFPNKPTLTANNQDFAIDQLRFTPSSFSDPQGEGTYAATQWRVAQISSPGVPGHEEGTPWKYELESNWISPEISSNEAFTFPIGIVEAGKRYRVRVRHKDTSGNWSYWSEPITFDGESPPPYALIHYWNFNASLSVPSLSLLGGRTTISGPSESGNSNNFAAANARNEDPAGNHLRINDPLTEGRSVTWEIPTIGFEDILVRYETRRSGQGAGTQIIDYTTDDGETWNHHSSIVVQDIGGNDVVPIVSLDFRDIAGVADNSRFAIRVTFEQGDGGLSGNNRFDNFTVEGRPVGLEDTLIHYWNFNTSLSVPSFTLLGGEIEISGPSESGNGNNFAATNARNEDPAEDHLRINDPLTEGRSITWKTPTTGFKDILVKYETRRSGQGAGTQIIEYTTDDGETWNHHANIAVLDVGGSAVVPIVLFDFRDIVGVSNNPHFAIRVTFEQGEGGEAGNNRFDNFTVEGRPVHPDFSSWREFHFDGEELEDDAISGPNADPSGSGITHLMRYALGVGPAESIHGILPKLEHGEEEKTFHFLYNPAAGVIWRVQASNSLEDWTQVLLDSDETLFPVKRGWVEVHLPASLSGEEELDEKMFLRLQVVEK